ncbi:hypothetical protein D3C74_453370 [compost metagenome]
MVVGFQLGILGVVADLISNNRKLLEESLYRIKKIELKPETGMIESEEHQKPHKQKMIS